MHLRRSSKKDGVRAVPRLAPSSREIAAPATGWRRVAREVRAFVTQRNTTLFACLILLVLAMIVLIGPALSPYDPNALAVSDRLHPPSSRHLFGTDNFGRDVLSRVLFGTRTTLLLALAISIFTLVLGVPLGVLCGYSDLAGTIGMRIVDAIMAFPAIMLALSLMAVFGKPGMQNVILAVGIVWVPRMVRVVYSATLSIRETTYVEAARAFGCSPLRIVIRHIVINLMSPVIVQVTFTFAFSVMEVAALGFLGVGLPPHIASWGGMMNEGRMYITRASWIIFFPGLFLAFSVLSFNLIGDALRDRLDPRLRRSV